MVLHSSQMSTYKVYPPNGCYSVGRIPTWHMRVSSFKVSDSGEIEVLCYRLCSTFGINSKNSLGQIGWVQGSSHLLTPSTTENLPLIASLPAHSPLSKLPSPHDIQPGIRGSDNGADNKNVEETIRMVLPRPQISHIVSFNWSSQDWWMWWPNMVSTDWPSNPTI